MTYGEYKKYILMKMDEYDSASKKMTASEDILQKLPFALSEAMRFVFYGKNIKKLWHINQGEDFNLIKNNFCSQHKTEDVKYTAKGAYGYYFETDDKADVYIYENGNLIREIHTQAAAYPEFTAHKGLLAGGDVKIIFSGDCYYNFRNVCLYSVRFSSEARIPCFSEQCAHDIPKGLYKVERVSRLTSGGTREYVPFEVQAGKLLLPRYFQGCFMVESSFFPPVITEETSLDEEISVPLDTEYLIIAKTCALLSQDADVKEFAADVDQGMLMLEKERSAEITVKKAGDARWLI